MFPYPPRLAYRLLLRSFGPQGWWPVTRRTGEPPRYRPGRYGRLGEREALEVAVGAILTQNTSWGNVEKAVASLHRASGMRLSGLLRLRPRRLQRLIRSSGYFRQKAGKLRVFLRALERRRVSLGSWLGGGLQCVRGELLGLYGIGPETADSILLYAGSRPAFVVDAYTLRIGARVGWFAAGTDYERAQLALTRRLPRAVTVYQEFHALLVALAKTYCRAQPLCPACPLRGGCRHGGGMPRLLRTGMLFLLLSPCIAWAGARERGARLYAAAGKAEITPDLGRESVWLAGYGAAGRRAVGVHDPLYARAVILSDGEKTVALVSVDSIGLFRQDVLRMRRELGWEGGKSYLFVAATHDHSAPDTLGLWGRFPGASGVDARYHGRLIRSVVSLVRGLSERLEEARLRAAKVELDPAGLCRDSRDPVVMDPELQVLQVEAARGLRAPAKEGTIATLVRWSCHPEVLGSDNRYVTADYPGTLCGRIEAARGGTCVFFSGAVGGLMTPDTKGRPGDVKLAFSEAKRVGEALADRAMEALRRAGSPIDAARVSFRSSVVRVPVENSRYLLFLPSLAFGHELSDAAGRPLPRWKKWWLPLRHLLFFPLPERLRPWVETELSLLRVGPVSFLGVPGELFPELALGGYDGRYRFSRPLLRPDNPSPPDLSRAPRGPALRKKLGGRYGWIIGLANDELGYIVPEYDFKIAPTRSLAPRPSGHHYEETNSIGPSATRLLLDGYDALLSSP